MIKHKPKTKEAVTIGHETYTPDEDGFIYLPYKYKKYNPVIEKKKRQKRKKTEEDTTT